MANTADNKEIQNGVEYPPVKSRLVLNFPGFEGTSPTRQLQRMTGNGEKFSSVWNIDLSADTIEEEPQNHLAVANFTASGKNWETRTRLVQFDWHDIIAKYEEQPYPQSLFANFPKYLSFFLDGTIVRYFIHHWRYGGFTIFPLLVILIFAIPAWYLSKFIVASLFGPTLIGASILTFLLVMILIKWPGDRLYMSLTINDWGFARDLTRKSNPAIEKRFDEFAERLRDEIDNSNHDEIIIAGHSFGTIWAVQALARALKVDPQLIATGRVNFLSLGSSLPKINLVPAAKSMREMTRIVMDQKNLLWEETQTHIDLIAFCGTNPELNLGLDKAEAQIHIQKVRYSRVMEKRRYRKMRKSFYRSHRQYIMYQDKRCNFDFFLKCFGPLHMRQLARDHNSMNRIDIEGQLHDDPVTKE